MRFDDKTLSGFLIDPTLPGYWATCPFCGGTLVVGSRADTKTRTLAHSAVADPLNPGAMLAGCERFSEVGLKDAVAFFGLCHSASVHWERLTG